MQNKCRKEVVTITKITYNKNDNVGADDSVRPQLKIIGKKIMINIIIERKKVMNEKNKQLEIAKKSEEMNMSLLDIEKATGLSLEEIKNL